MIDFDGYSAHLDHHFRPLPHKAPNAESAKDFESAPAPDSWIDVLQLLLSLFSESE